MDPLGIALTLAALLLCIGVLARLAWRSRAVQRSTRAAAQRGYRGEREAAQALENLGFRVLEHHPEARYDLYINGAPKQVRMTADYLVERGGHQWIVEVKTGAGARPASRNTRRQLLEYAEHYPVAGVYLFDADAQALSLVEFPQKPTNSTKFLVAGLFIGILLGFGLRILTH
jgi:hypothetical protein